MRVCVFCGSSTGKGPGYLAAAERVGRTLAERGIGVVYGGASVGTMGAVADAALAAGGSVVGVIPRSLVDREVAHAGLSELHVVADLHERKAEMASLADAFLALPGGAGTLEELFEVFTWAQLGLHRKPIALLDVQGYYQPLVRALDHMVEEGFLSRAYRGTSSSRRTWIRCWIVTRPRSRSRAVWTADHAGCSDPGAVAPPFGVS